MFHPIENKKEQSSSAILKPYADSLISRNWPRLLTVFVIVTLATAFSVAWIDLPLARFVASVLARSSTHFVAQAQYPDLLDLFVAIVTTGSLIGYIVLRRRQHRRTRLACCLQMISAAVPFGYTAKNLLKAVFGRVNTRYWIHHPSHFEFHWLHASDRFFGFPSGHLTVFAAFAFTLMHYYPRLRSWGWAVILLLAAALIVSEYHFLGDIIAGTYIGYLAFLAAHELLDTHPQR